MNRQRRYTTKKRKMFRLQVDFTLFLASFTPFVLAFCVNGKHSINTSR